MVLKKSEIQFLRHETHETEQNEQTLHLRDPVRSKALKAWEIFIGHLQIQLISTRKRTAVEHGGAVKAAPLRLLVPFLQLLQLLLHVVVVGTQKGQLLGDPPGKIRKEKKETNKIK
jgi:hypothetical protein